MLSKQCLCLLFLLFPLLLAAADEKQAENGGVKVQGAADNSTVVTPAPPTNETTTTTLAPDVPSEPECSGFGAGSIFVAILFGMGLMFGLSKLYAHWEKSRMEDPSNYRGY